MIEEFCVRATSKVGEPTGGAGDTYALVDSVLIDPFGRPIAIIEAKRSTRDPLEGERQASDYADDIRAEHGVAPFIFLANGDEIWFWHRQHHLPISRIGCRLERQLRRS
ncbi:hypothetical protein G3480_22035 [Thiorhodococcus mannitoliphagus]|uniref:Restriction endonuclease type I HsdR N-terminal domain-containing protein n=1 Tax=Thiorhodococcus mannitoliphagus TaxID=329406 RepID=A0A6P1E1K6_9GAMM|nr:type I restriction endonuclease [Thiorhodococcus mannitoliphagus]NEX22946.1 hypothetical protein [Thiorhodococcus mannitoliphagus]